MTLCAETAQRDRHMHVSHNPDTRFLSPGVHERRFSGLILSSGEEVLGQFGWAFVFWRTSGAGGLGSGIF